MKDKGINKLKEEGFRFKKSLGQNFLTDHNIIEKIIKVAGIDKNTNVIEIGPGAGALTKQLVNNAQYVLAYEIDNKLVNYLQEKFSDEDNIRILAQDFLTAKVEDDLTTLPPAEKTMVVANLPYYITTPIIFKLLEYKGIFTKLVVMVQKEVALRMGAMPNTKDYGVLTLNLSYATEVKIEFIVPRNVFVPAPEVDSAIVSLTFLPKTRVTVRDEELFFAVIKASFANRRKTILNNLANNLLNNLNKVEISELLETALIDPKRRGESLTINEFANLANIIAEKRKK